MIVQSRAQFLTIVSGQGHRCNEFFDAIRPVDQERATQFYQELRAREQGAWERLLHLYTPLVVYWCRHGGVHAQDAENDSLTYSLRSPLAGMSIDPQLGTIRWTPTADLVGLQTAVLRVTDYQGSSAVQSLPIIVRSVNVPPVITSTPPTQAALSTAVARLLVQNNESEEQADQQIRQIYDRVQRQVYLFLGATLTAILLTSLYLIHTNRRLFAQMAAMPGTPVPAQGAIRPSDAPGFGLGYGLHVPRSKQAKPDRCQEHSHGHAGEQALRCNPPKNESGCT